MTNASNPGGNPGVPLWMTTIMRMFERRVPAAVCAFLLAGTAWAAEWRVDDTASTLEFAGESQGERFEGRFGRFDAAIRFDPANPSDARFDVTVDLASVDSANSERDETLLGPDFFDVAGMPQSRYVAGAFRPTPDGFVAEGELTLNGVTAPVPLAFRWQPTASGAILEGRATLDRLRFGLGTGDWADPDVIAHAVEVHTRLVLVPAADTP